MANFFVAGPLFSLHRTGSTPCFELTLQALYTFWRFQKISQKVLRSSTSSLLTPRLEFHPFA